MRARVFAASLLAAALAACATGPFPVARNAHIRADAAPPEPVPGAIPRPVQQAIVLPPPKPAARAETYSVVVNNVRAQDLLFALARDAKLNVDIHPGIAGTVTLNAIDQTLPQLLNRISKQVDMRYELDGPNLLVMPDSPYLRTYRVDYVNMSRELTGTVSINTQIASGGSASGGLARRARLGPSAPATSPPPASRTNPRTASGTTWKRTSRTSCGRPTRSCRKAPAIPSSNGWARRLPLVAARRRAPRVGPAPPPSPRPPRDCRRAPRKPTIPKPLWCAAPPSVKPPR